MNVQGPLDSGWVLESSGARGGAGSPGQPGAGDFGGSLFNIFTEAPAGSLAQSIVAYSTFTGNRATGGDGGEGRNGGGAFGGGIRAFSDPGSLNTVTVSQSTITGSQATGGSGGNAQGGGLSDGQGVTFAVSHSTLSGNDAVAAPAARR